MLNRLKYILCCAIALSIAVFSLLAVDATTTEAVDLSQNCTVDGTGFSDFNFLTDQKQNVFRQSGKNATVNITCDTEISSLYIVFGKAYGQYTITDNTADKSVTVGDKGFLHDYIDLLKLFGKPTKSVTLSFKDKKVTLGEIYAFSSGETPDFVQKWNPPAEGNADLVLFSTHGDDDQLYFAGLLPHYAVDKGYNVQVVYMTDHRNSSEPRAHEMLNGLWAVGIRSYPVFGEFYDFRIDDKDKTYQRYEELGTSYEDLLGFVTEQIRRFKPLVTVGHDFNGEYGHGMHKVYADLVSKAIGSAADGSQFPESASKYGTWQVSKAYFHLYKENQITLDFDAPKECFNGLSAFQMAQKHGFPCHESQQKYSFKDWLNGKNGEITRATQIKSYNPAEYGLFYSTVGEDIAKNDMFENVVLRNPNSTEASESLNSSESSSVIQNTSSASKDTPSSKSDSDTKINIYTAIAIGLMLLVSVKVTGVEPITLYPV